MIKIPNKHFKKLAYTLAIASSPFPILASQLEEVVITAQKREQSLQDVPISVIAMSGDELENLNRNEITELTKSIAGFTFQSGSGDSERAIQVRGVGTSTFSQGVEQSVGTVVDGVVASGLVASFLDFSDVERIEVLRGPQGMLFGKNASAGLLNISTIKPTADFSYGASASFAEKNEEKFTAYVSGGLTDNVLARFSAYSNTRDGIIDNINSSVSGTYNNRDEWGISGKLLIEPSDELSVLLSVRHSERDISCCYRPPVEVVGPFSTVLPSGQDNDQIFEITTYSPNEANVDVYSIEVNYDIGENTLTSISSYTDTHTYSNIVATGLPVNLLDDNFKDSEIEQITQELRITSPADLTVNYVAGLYYYNNELDYNQARIFNPPFSQQPTTAGFEAQSIIESQSLAVFGQLTWNISDANRLSVGLRYNDEEISLDQTLTDRLGSSSFPNPTRSSTVNDEAISWRIIAEQDIDAGMIYATVARGYKGPGANTLASGFDAAKPIVDAEIPTNYELGIKSELFDGGLRLNANIFLTEFKDFQASLSDNEVPPSFFLSNAGKLKTQGVEIEVTSQATDNLFVSANIAYIDASFVDFEGAACYPDQDAASGCVGGTQDLSGKDLPFSPDLTLNLFARYDIELANLPFNAYLQGAYHWQDEVQFNTSNDPKTIHDAYGIADLAVGIESDEGNYSMQLFVKNAFDEFYASGYTTQGTPFGVALAQSLEYDYTRRVGIKFAMDF